MLEITEHILMQYLEGRLTKQETVLVEAWLKESKEREKMIEELVFTLELTDRLYVYQTAAGSDGLQTLKKKIKRKRHTNFRSLAWKNVQRAAAILFIPVLIFAGYTLKANNIVAAQVVEVYSNPGVISTFQLPDGTKVWLNGGSTLKYPSGFEPTNRTIELSGQGFFEVKTMKEKPFIVKVDPCYSVTVTGTSFNISAYEEEEMIETSLVEGAVTLSYKQLNGKYSSKKLAPNEKAAYRKTSGELTVGTVNTEFDTAWKQGEIKFRNHSMEHVLRVLSRHYNVKFEIKDPEIYQSNITATFRNEQLPQVMDYLGLASGIKYSIHKPAITQENRLEPPIIEITK